MLTNGKTLKFRAAKLKGFTVISFEPRMRLWLADAINGLVGPEALEDTGDCRKHSGRSPDDDPVGPSLDPLALSHSVISFESRTQGWLNLI